MSYGTIVLLLEMEEGNQANKNSFEGLRDEQKVPFRRSRFRFLTFASEYYMCRSMQWEMHSTDRLNRSSHEEENAMCLPELCHQEELITLHIGNEKKEDGGNVGGNAHSC